VNRGDRCDRRIVRHRPQRVGKELRVLGRRTGDVERIARRDVLGDQLLQTRLRGLGERGQRQSDELGAVGDDVARTARDRDDAETSARQRARPCEQPGRDR
jgi:hypothetical protein